MSSPTWTAAVLQIVCDEQPGGLEKKLESLPSNTSSGSLHSNLVPEGVDAGMLLDLHLPLWQEIGCSDSAGAAGYLPVLAKLCLPSPTLT